MNKKSNLFKIIILISLGLFAIITPSKYINVFHFITYIGILLLGIYEIIKFLRKEKINFNNIIYAIIAIILFLLLKDYKTIYMTLIPIIGGLYIFIIGLTRLISFFIYKDIPESKVLILLNSLIHIIFGLMLIMNPLATLRSYTVILGIYLVLLGISYLPKNNQKNSFHIIPIPTLIQSLNPYSDYLKIMNKKMQLKENDDEKCDVEILIHVRKHRRGIFGHADFVYQNNVYSYGNYDKNSFKLGDAIGEGLLIKAKKDEYIKYCKSYGKSLFSFGIKFNDDELSALDQRFKNIMNNTIVFPKEKIVKNTYIDELNQHIKVTFYKFKNGYYKNYFFLNYNCVKFIESIISPKLVDFTSIKTPGTLYSYLDNLYKSEDRHVVSKKLY